MIKTQLCCLWALSTTTNEAINREPQLVATGATAAPTDTEHSTAYPGGGSSKKIMAVESTIFPPARPGKRDEKTKRSTQNTENVGVFSPKVTVRDG